MFGGDQSRWWTLLVGKPLWCTLFWGSCLLKKQAEEKHSIVDCCCGEMQLSGKCCWLGTGDWGTYSSRNYCIINSAVETSLMGNWGSCWLLTSGEKQLSGSSPDWGVYCSRVYRSRTSAVGKSLLGKALLEEASCRRTSYYYFTIPHHLNSRAGCHVSLLLFLCVKCYHM